MPVLNPKKVRPNSLTLQTTEGKTYQEMSKKEKDILSGVLKWNGKTLKDCSRGELIDCIVHTTQQVVLLQYDLEKIKKQRGVRAMLERVRNWFRKYIGRYFVKPVKAEGENVQPVP
jgi:hypothetical protein